MQTFKYRTRDTGANLGKCSQSLSSSSYPPSYRRCRTASRGSSNGFKSRSRAPLTVKAIGFDFGDQDAYEDARKSKANKPKIKAFGLLSSSLLVYQHVLKGVVECRSLALVTFVRA